MQHAKARSTPSRVPDYAVALFVVAALAASAALFFGVLGG